MSHMDSSDTREEIKTIKSEVDMVKGVQFEFFRSVLARKIVDPPLSESDATPSLISSDLVWTRASGGGWAARAGLKRPGRAGVELRCLALGTNQDSTMMYPFSKCRFVLLIIKCLFLFRKNYAHQLSCQNHLVNFESTRQ